MALASVLILRNFTTQPNHEENIRQIHNKKKKLCEIAAGVSSEPSSSFQTGKGEIFKDKPELRIATVNY